jgi:AcrR family transcriptional regulator
VNERWLDAAESCYTRFGLAKTTVEDVARAAGVSRATLYRHFGSRNDLLVGVIARDARRLAAEAAVTIQRFDDVGSWIVEGILLCLREIPRRPMLAMLFAPEEVGAASRLVLTSEQLLAIGADFLRPMFALAGERRLLREGVQRRPDGVGTAHPRVVPDGAEPPRSHRRRAASAAPRHDSAGGVGERPGRSRF